MVHEVPKTRAPGHTLGQSAAPPIEPSALEHDLDDTQSSDEIDAGESILYSAPFEPRSFGAELVWAKGEHYVAKILRVRAGQLVKVSALRRRDMVLLLTGGRAQIESYGESDDPVRHEMQPAIAFVVDPALNYRLSALTDVELFTIYTEAAP